MRLLLLKKQVGWAKTPTGRRRKKLLEQRANKPEVKVEFKDNVFGWRSSKRWRRSHHTTYKSFGQDIWGSVSMRRSFSRIALNSWKLFWKCCKNETLLYRSYTIFVKGLLKKYGSLFGIPPLLWRFRTSIRKWQKIFYTMSRRLSKLFLKRKYQKRSRFRFDSFFVRLKKFKYSKIFDLSVWKDLKRVRKQWVLGLKKRLPLFSQRFSDWNSKFIDYLDYSKWSHNFVTRSFLEKNIEGNIKIINNMGRSSGSRARFENIRWWAGLFKKEQNVTFYWDVLFCPWKERLGRLRYSLKIVPPIFLNNIKTVGFWNFMDLNAGGDGTIGMFGQEVVRKPKTKREDFVPFSLMSANHKNIRIPHGPRNQNLRMRRRHQLFYGGMSSHEYKRFSQKHIRTSRSLSSVYSLLERRLDVLLVRGLIFRTVFEAQRAIRSGKITVGGIIVRLPDFIVKPMEIVSIYRLYRIDFQARVIANVLDDRVLDSLPEYLMSDYRFLGFLFNPCAYEEEDVVFPSEDYRNVGKW